MLIGFNGYDFTDGAHLLGTFSISANTSSTLPTTATGKYGYGSSISLSNSGSGNYTYGGYSFTATSTIIQGSHVNHTNVLGAGHGFFHLLDSVTSQVSCWCNSDGSISVFRGGDLITGSGSTLLGSSSGPVLLVNNWHHIEWEVFISTTVGTVIVKVDGTTVINLTGQNTQATGNNTCSAAVIHYADTSSNATLFDNTFVLDTTGSSYNTFLGPRTVTTHVPISNGSNINWLPLVAPNFLQINETSGVPLPDGDVSYIYSIAYGSSSSAAKDVGALQRGGSSVGALFGSLATTTLVDTYHLNSFASLGNNNAIQLCMFARSTVASGTRQIQATLFTGGILYTGTIYNVTSTSYSYFIDTSFFLTDPAASLPWNANVLNSYEFGLTNVGNGILDSTDVRLSQLKIERLGTAPDFFVPNHPFWQTS